MAFTCFEHPNKRVGERRNFFLNRTKLTRPNTSVDLVPMASSSSSSSSDFSSGEISVPPKQRKGPPYIMLVPLIYAPALPLIRIGFRHNPVLRDRLFYGVLAGAFAHGAYLISEIYDIESK